MHSHSQSQTGSKVQLDGLQFLEHSLSGLGDRMETGAQLLLELAGEVDISRNKAHLEQLTATTEYPANLDSEITIMKQALAFIKEKAIPNCESSSKSVDLARVYQNKFDELSGAVPSATAHKYVKSFQQHVKRYQGSREEELEEDILLSQVKVSTICPLTQQQLKSPMKNSRCGHVYSRLAIIAHIRAKRPGAQCPASCCAFGVVSEELSPDKEMEGRIRRENRARKSEGKGGENVLETTKK